MQEELIKRSVAYPLAISVFKKDKDNFKKVKFLGLYLDLLESIIERMQQDYFNLKAQLYTKHHLDIKRIDSSRYMVNNEILEFTSEELKESTKLLMIEYLYGNKSAAFERKERVINSDKIVH